MTKDNLPETQIEAIRYFSSPECCHEFLVGLRWPGGVKCPRCHSDRVGVFSGARKVSNCKECKKQFTVKVGTIFEDSPLGLDKWLPAVWMIVTAKNGVSSCELARSLGVTQKTAWHMGHRIRKALRGGTFEKFVGDVEADETFIGGAAKNMHPAKRKASNVGPGGIGKVVVHGILERTKKNGVPSRVRAEVVPDTKMATLSPILHDTVKQGSRLYTDTATSYRQLKSEFSHYMIDHHLRRYVKGRVHTNGIENFWSLLKRSVKGTYICPRPAHMFRYLDEQVYRFNERKGTDKDRFLKAAGSLFGKRLTYKELTSS